MSGIDFEQAIARILKFEALMRARRRPPATVASTSRFSEKTVAPRQLSNASDTGLLAVRL
jgi:hypothetical protein